MLNYGAYTVLSVLGGGILLYIDTLMVSSQLGLGAAGIYSTVFLLSTFLSFPFRSITKIAHPIVSKFWKEKKIKEMATLYTQTTEVCLVIGGILLLLVWVNIDALFSFLPKEYALGKNAFLIICLGKYIDMVTGINGIITVTSKKYRYDIYFILILVVTIVVMNLIFIPIYGMSGASLATTLGLAIINIFRIWFVKHFFKMQPFSANGLWIFLISIAVWALSFLLPHINNRYLSITAYSIIVSIVYMGSITLLKLSPEVNNLVYGYTKLKFLLPKTPSTSN